jgi:neurofibromin 1
VSSYAQHDLRIFFPGTNVSRGCYFERPISSHNISVFRALSRIILEAVEPRFPDATHAAVGSFIFLRFFCPAIVSPDTVDLDVPSDIQVRRALLLVTKVIQNIVNGVGFGVKEPHMKVLNGFLEKNGQTVMVFLEGIAVCYLC